MTTPTAPPDAAPTATLDEAVEAIRLRLAGWANQLAARFAAPVYLVGSALTTTSPRDIDVRVVLDDDAFEARYGVSAAEWAREMWGTWSAGSLRWGADMAKLNAQAVKAFAWNLDVQVHPEIAAVRHADCPRLRLDALREGPDFVMADAPPPGWPPR